MGKHVTSRTRLGCSTLWSGSRLAFEVLYICIIKDQIQMQIKISCFNRSFKQVKIVL